MKICGLGVILFSFIFTAGGCATHEALEKYPRRQIDRPYTLPKTLNEWNPHLSWEQNHDNTSVSTNSQIAFNPFKWRESLNDDLTLVWNVLPLGLRVPNFA